MRRIILAFFCGMLAAAAVRAQDAADLARGIELYMKADYKTAIAVLQAMDESTLRKDEQVTRLKFLALSLIGRKERGRAQEEFVKLLEIEPDYELSDKEVSPSVLELFKQSKIAQGGRVCDRAVEAYKAGRFGEAVPDFELALRLSPNDTRAREFLRLAGNRVKEEEEEQRRKEEEEKVEKNCSPVRAWGELDATNVTCQGIDYSSSLQLPIQANRVTLIYNKHHFGVGTCWKIILYDPEGKEVLVFDDANQEFSEKRKPSQEKRWRVVDLPEIHTIARVVMHGQGGHDLERFMGRRVGKDLADEFILGLEVICPHSKRGEGQEPGTLASPNSPGKPEQSQQSGAPPPGARKSPRAEPVYREIGCHTWRGCRSERRTRRALRSAAMPARRRALHGGRPEQESCLEAGRSGRPSGGGLRRPEVVRVAVA